MKTISYAITVCNEITEIAVLVDTLKEKLREGDEIVIQYDEDSVTDVVMEYLNIMKNMHKDFIKALEPSSLAAYLFGPNTRILFLFK